MKPSSVLTSRRMPFGFVHRSRILVAIVLGNVLVVGAVLRSPQRAPVVLAALLAVPAVGALGWLIVQRPQRGILLLAALLPFHGLTEITPVPPSWKEGLTLAIVAATFLAPASARGQRGRKLPSWSFALGAFLALALISAALVGGTKGLVGLKVGFFYVLLAFAVWRCPLGRIERDRLVTILMATGFIASVVGLAQQVIGDSRLVDLGYTYNRTVRFAGGQLRSFSTFSLSFPFCLFVMLVLLIGLPVALQDPHRRRNRLFLLATPVLLAGLASSITRGGWLGLLIGVLYLGFIGYRRLLTGLFHAVAIGIILVIAFAGVSATFFSEESTEERVEIWRENVAQIGSHPFGLGLAATGSAAEKLAADDEFRTGVALTETLTPDNYYFKTALELGVIGLWVFLVLLVTCFSSAHSASRTLRGSDAAFASGVAASVLAAAGVSLFATYFEIFPLEAYFWLLMTVVATTVASQSPDTARARTVITR